MFKIGDRVKVVGTFSNKKYANQVGEITGVGNIREWKVRFISIHSHWQQIGLDSNELIRLTSEKEDSINETRLKVEDIQVKLAELKVNLNRLKFKLSEDSHV